MTVAARIDGRVSWEASGISDTVITPSSPGLKVCVLYDAKAHTILF